MPPFSTRRALPALLAAFAVGPTAGAGQAAPAVPSISAGSATVPLNAVAAFTVSGVSGNRVRLEVLRSGRWFAVGPVVVLSTPGETLWLRAGGHPGTMRVRLRHGPGLRGTTAPVGIRVVRTGRLRVLAGHTPVQALVHGRDLWVFTWNPDARRPELRLLDARTGQRRGGPVRLPKRFRWGDWHPPLLVAGRTPLLDAPPGGALPLTALDAANPRLLGPPARFLPGSCGAVCTPNRIVVRGRATVLTASLGARLAPVRGPDGRFWDLAPATDVPWEDEPPSRLLMRHTASAAASAVGVPGAMGPGHAGLHGSILAVRGGAWIRTIEGRVRWASVDGGLTDVPVQDVHLAGRCAWGYRANPAYGPSPEVVPLAPGSAAVRAAVRVPAGRITVGHRVAWVVSQRERTLIRVPLPAC